MSGPQPIGGPLEAHFSEFGKTDSFSLHKERLRHSPHLVVIRGPLVAHSWPTRLSARNKKRVPGLGENFIFYADKMCTVKYQSSSYQDYVNVNGRRTRVTVNWKTGVQEITCQKFVPLGGTPRRAPAKTCGSVPLTQCCGTFDQWSRRALALTVIF